MNANVWDVLAVAFFVGIIYVLVRPRSKALDAVNGAFDLFIGMVRQAVDLANT